MAGKIEIRKAGERFRFVVLGPRGAKLAQSGMHDTKAQAKRAAQQLANAAAGAEVVDASAPATSFRQRSKPKPASRRKPAAARSKPAGIARRSSRSKSKPRPKPKARARRTAGIKR